MLATVLFVVAVPVLLITANIRYLLGDVSFYERGLRKYDAVEATGISLDDLDRASAEIIRYFEDDSDTLLIIVVEDGQEASLFNSRETRHMEDVKRLVRFTFRLNEISLAFVVIYVAALVLWSRERSLRRLAGETLTAIGLAFTVLTSASVFFLIMGFHDAWDQLHRVVFPSGFWQLNPRTDHLIQMFPEEFWAEATMIAGGLSFASFAVLVILAGSYLAITRPKKPLREPAMEMAEAALGESVEAPDADLEGTVDSAEDSPTTIAATGPSQPGDVPGSDVEPRKGSDKAAESPQTD